MVTKSLKKVIKKTSDHAKDKVVQRKKIDDSNNSNKKRGIKRKIEDEPSTEVKDNLTLAIHFSGKIDTSQIKKFLSASDILYKDMTFYSKKNICYIQVADKANFLKALELSGSEISGITTLIREAQHIPTGPYIIKKMKLDDCTNRKRLILKNLPHNLSINELKKQFSSAVCMKLPREPGSKKFKSYGFLEFQDEEAANKVLERTQGLLINGCAIKVDRILSRDQVPKSSEDSKVSTCLLVKQLPYAVTSEMLKVIFPESKSIRVISDPKTKKSKGFAFVEFNNVEDAQLATSMKQGEEFQGRKMAISFATKKTRRVRKAKPSKAPAADAPEPME